MKLNNLQKTFCIFFSIVLSIIVGTLLWGKIVLPIYNPLEIKGFLVLKNYNPTNDTARYIFFIVFPLLVFIFSKSLFSNEKIKIREIIFENENKILNDNKNLKILLFLFFCFIIFEFLSLNFPIRKIDLFHDGDYLTSPLNYLFTKKLWISSYTVHGGSNIFYPILAWKLFGVESIGAARFSSIFIILLIKFFSVLLSYQITKILKLNKETQLLFFTILSLILLSMSYYSLEWYGYYFSHRDIFVILFLIFFIELFIDSKFKFISTISIVVVANISILFHIDIGIYINFILFFYFLYLTIAKKFYDILVILFVFLISWTLTIYIIGLDEFVFFLDHVKTIALSMDLMHALEYPHPFFSILTDSNGARATKGLLLQLSAGLLVLNYLISKNKITNSKKILFLFLFLLSFIMYKNALGRSDSNHIRMSLDLPILINSFFIIHYILNKISIKKSVQNFLNTKVSFLLSIFILIFFTIVNKENYNFNYMINFKKNLITYVNIEDKYFLNEKTIKVINAYKKIIKNDNCVENISLSPAFPYLLKKPSCTKYYNSYLASPITKQKDYIEQIKKNDIKYILHEKNDSNFINEIDGISLYERLELVNSYISKNYSKYKELEGFLIFEKK
tara:strand:- start:4269 stop:6131 length:1863 start_codon:yes stop_codon:yes gene_type:complete